MELMYCELLIPIETRNIYFKTILLEILVDRQRLETSNNLTCLVIHQTELLHSGLLDTKEIRCLLLELTELNVLRDRELAGNGSVVRFLRAVDDNLLG